MMIPENVEKDAKKADQLSRNKPSTAEPSERPAKYKAIKLIVFAFYTVCMGLTFALLGPTLPALRDRLDVEYSELSSAISAVSGGLVAGGVVGGLLLDRVKHHGIFLALAVLVRSACTFAVPFCPNVYFLAVALFFLAFGGGMAETGVGKEVMQLFAPRGASAQHLMRFCFSIGGFLAPAIARSFIQQPAPETPDQNSTQSYSYEEEGVEIHSTVEYAFFIIGGMCSLSTICIFVVYLYDRCHYEMTTSRPKSAKKTCGPEEADRAPYKLCLLFILPWYFFSSMGGNSLNKYVAAFGIESEVGLSYSMATLLTTVFWVCSAASRLLGIGLSLLFKPRGLIIGQTVVILLSALLLIFYGYHNEYMLWVGIAMFATGQGVSWANGVAWSFQYFEPNAFMYMIFMIAGGFGGMTSDYLTGVLFDANPFYFTYLLLGIGCFNALLFVGLEVMACGLNTQKQEPTVEQTKL